MFLLYTVRLFRYAESTYCHCNNLHAIWLHAGRERQHGDEDVVQTSIAAGATTATAATLIRARVEPCDAFIN